MKFSLIICGYNEEENLDLCIQSCLDLDYPKDEYEIIYVDNNSKDNSINIAKKYPIKVLIEKKQGLSEARNYGIQNSKGEILVFLDADLKLDKDYLKYHEETFKDEIVGAGGGKVLPLIRTWISDYLGVSLFEGYPRFITKKFVRTYPGCNLTIRKKVLENIGFFKEGLISATDVTRFAEDKEICERIGRAGYKILYNPKPIVYHKNTFLFNKLIQIWIKGAKGRINLIHLDKKDFFTVMFKYNVSLFLLLVLIFFMVINYSIGILLVLLCCIFIFIICVKIFKETGLFLQSFFIKPWMDVLSLIIINISVISNRVKKW